jgi:hypothetical protein
MFKYFLTEMLCVDVVARVGKSQHFHLKFQKPVQLYEHNIRLFGLKQAIKV